MLARAFGPKGSAGPRATFAVGLTDPRSAARPVPRAEAAAARWLPRIPLDSDTRAATTVTHVMLALRDGGVGGGPKPGRDRFTP